MSPRGSLVRNESECVAAAFCILSFRQEIESWDRVQWSPMKLSNWTLHGIVRKSSELHGIFEISFCSLLLSSELNFCSVLSHCWPYGGIRCILTNDTCQKNSFANEKINNSTTQKSPSSLSLYARNWTPFSPDLASKGALKGSWKITMPTAVSLVDPKNRLQQKIVWVSNG